MLRRSLFSLLLPLLFAACSTDPQTRLDQIEGEAMAAIAELHLQQARDLAAEAGEIDPSNPLPAYIEGRIMEAQLQWLDALYNYTLVAMARPDYAQAYTGLYRVYRQLSDAEMAGEAAQSYSTLRPQDSEGRVMMVHAMIDLKQYVRARRQLDEAQELGLSEARLTLLRAVSFAEQNQFDSAAQLLGTIDRSLTSDPQDQMLIADILGLLGATDSAMTVSSEAVASSNGDLRFVTEHFYRALDFDYHWAARETIYSLGESDNSRPLRDMMWMLYYADADRQSYARSYRVQVGGSMGETMSVLFYGILSIPPGMHMMATMDDVALIRSRIRQQEWPEPLQAYVDYLLATRMAAYLDEKSTVRALEAVRAPMVNRPEVKVDLALYRKRVGLNDQADQALDLLVQYHREQPQWLTAIGDAYTNHAYRAWDRAAGLYEEALQSDSNYRPAFEHWVGMHIDNEEFGEALDVMGRYAHFVERYPELGCLKAEMMVRTGRFADGVALFEKRIRECPHVLELWEGMTEPLLLEQRLQERGELAQLAEELAEGNPDLLVLAADLASDRGDFEHALGLTERALTIEPGSHDAAAEKGRALYFLNRKDEAFELFAETRKTHRLNSRNTYWYSRLLARDQRDLQLAANVAREAMFNRPENVWPWCNLSYVYYQSARWQLAFGEARNCAQRYPDHPLPYFRRGLAEWQMDKPEAAETLKKALQLGLWGEFKAEAQEALKRIR